MIGWYLKCGVGKFDVCCDCVRKLCLFGWINLVNVKLVEVLLFLIC